MKSDVSTRSAEPSWSLITTALVSCRRAFLAVGVFSGAINILMLSGSLFMLQVYDRVLPSRSVPTLIGLLAMVTVLYAFQGVFDLIRGRLLTRIAASLNEEFSSRTFEATVLRPLQTRSSADGLQPLRDLDQLRSFLSGTGPTALLDLPWMPLYLGLCFIFHAWIGVTALAGAIILIGLALVTEALTREPAKRAGGFAAKRLSLAESCRRNVEVLQAMGMVRRFAVRWASVDDNHIEANQRAADVAGGLGGASRVLRMLLQSAVLAVGAYLVINQEATGGIIIASSILVSRALAPVELSIANWKGFLAARQAAGRLSKLLPKLVNSGGQLTLPTPKAGISVEQVSAGAPGVPRLLIHDVSFRLQSGQGLGIIGPTAAGKSTLARNLVGVWQPARGKVCLDGAALDQWGAEALGKHVGYLPQDVELFEGSVAENISRFDPDADDAAIVAAAQGARVHDLIIALPDGYQTQIGEAGAALSAGQRQRIALARALYREPFLVVLDEPNSNLDAEGDEALTQAILGVRRRGGIVVLVAHRPSALQALDLILAMAHGRAQSFGPKDEILRQVTQSARPVPRSIKLVEETGDVAS